MSLLGKFAKITARENIDLYSSVYIWHEINIGSETIRGSWKLLWACKKGYFCYNVHLFPTLKLYLYTYGELYSYLKCIALVLWEKMHEHTLFKNIGTYENICMFCIFWTGWTIWNFFEKKNAFEHFNIKLTNVLMVNNSINFHGNWNVWVR